MENPYIDEWSSLHDTTRPVLDNISAKWEKLIHSERVSEHQVHRFLELHSHLVFRNSLDFCTVVTKLRFGADYISDLVLVFDERSEGVHYHLIELERPDTPPFTQEGIASSRLSRAIQQILSWKQWLADHPAEAGKLFPSAARMFGGRTSFSYGIYIGTRNNSAAWVDRRNTLAQSLGVKIRSFDSIGDRLKDPPLFSDLSSVGDEKHSCTLEVRNKLACPFLKAMTDGQWRMMIGDSKYPGHIMKHFSEHLVSMRQANRYLLQFRKLSRSHLRSKRIK